MESNSRMGGSRSPYGDDDALAIDIDAGDFAPLLPGGQGTPAFHQLVRLGGRSHGCDGKDRQRKAAQPADTTPQHDCVLRGGRPCANGLPTP